MQIPVLNGIHTDEASDFRTSYPRNLIPVPKQQGISNGYLRPTDGIVEFADISAYGIDRGGINWKGDCYRVAGQHLVKIDSSGVVTDCGTFLDSYTNYVKFDYSPSRLAIAVNKYLYYWNGTTLSRVIDSDLGNVNDMMWIDGYFMTTDGTYIIVTELADPTSVLPTKYGSAETDPDEIIALLKLNNEPYVLNRYTIEVFDNIGGSGFPYQRIEGALIERGCIGARACCVFDDVIAFVGSKKNEPIAIWLGANGGSVKISDREIDTILSDYTETVLSTILVEARIEKSHKFLYVHLPDQTLVYDSNASQVVKEPVWHILGSGLTANSIYRARNLTWCYNKWLVGDTDTGKIGYFVNDSGEHWGNTVDWEFGTLIVYNDSVGAIFHELELVALTGRAALGENPQISTEYSLDGETWSTPKYISAGKKGERMKRLIWLNNGSMANIRMQKFKGTSDARISIARLEARLEPLTV